jgi:2-(1,2-epoxy-1,2-dihydrophenyl)acetyl-CoA isomerase
MTVEVEDRENGIRIVRFTGASASKSFSRESLPIIAKTIDQGLNNSEVKGMVITGEGKFFSAGADIHAFQEAIDANDAPQLIRDLTNILHPLLVRMRQSGTIVVGAINGAAAGGGLGLALACDVRVASPKAKLAASYASIGLSPDGGTTWLLPRLVGEQRSRTFFFENQIWSAEQAKDAGAIDEVVEAEQLLERSVEIATNWSKWGGHFREATKHLLHVQSQNDFETHLKHEQTLIEAAGTTPEFKAGVSKFLGA